MSIDAVLDDQDFTEAKASLFPGKDGCLSGGLICGTQYLDYLRTGERFCLVGDVHLF